MHQAISGVRVQAEILRVHYEGNRQFNELAQDNIIEPKLNLNLKSPPPLHVACVTVKVVCFEYRDASDYKYKFEDKSVVIHEKLAPTSHSSDILISKCAWGR